MLQLREAGKGTLTSTHIIREHQESDAYKLEEHPLTLSHTAGEGQIIGVLPRLLEQRESDHRACEGSASLPAPLLRDQYIALPLAENTRPEEYTSTVNPATNPVPARLTQVQYRQALLEVDDPDAFWDGVVGGQIAMVEIQQPLTDTLIFELFEEATRDLEFSESWLVGYFLGLSDALLRHRKVYPHAYSAHLKPFKTGKNAR